LRPIAPSHCRAGCLRHGPAILWSVHDRGRHRIHQNALADDFLRQRLSERRDSKDTCPAAMWAKVDPKSLAKQRGVLSVFKNGPRSYLSGRCGFYAAQKSIVWRRAS
jgi:hypothetical protein